MSEPSNDVGSASLDAAQLCERISTSLLQLYRAANETVADQFQARALTLLQEVVPFDSAMWGSGSWSAAGVEVHSVFLDRQPPEMMQSYERVKQHDTFAQQTHRFRAITLNVSADDPRYVPHPDLAAHTRRYGMAHALGTQFDDGLQLVTSISLFRSRPAARYSETERLFVQSLVPHLAETWSYCLLRSVGDRADHGLAEASRALCDQKGLLHAAAPPFADLMRAEWPAWQGPKLPDTLCSGWLVPAHSQHVGAALVIGSEPVGDLRLLKLRRLSALDALTARELEVARLYGSGSSHKAIAQVLHVSPVTVRNHLQSTYSKLGVRDKAALATLLRAAEG